MNAAIDTDLYTADFILWVTGFNDIMAPIVPPKKGAPVRPAPTNYRLELLNPQRGSVFLKPSGHPLIRGQEVIRVQTPGAHLRFRVMVPFEPDENPLEGYLPVGVSFARVDDLVPRAVALSSPVQPGSPFSRLEIRQSLLQFTAIPQHGLKDQNGNWVSHITYKFNIFIQRMKDGAIGVIDPYEENDNPP
jgi:hypothetical protein